MKTKIKIILITLITFNFLTLQTFNCFAQAPQSFNYQLIARDTSGKVLINRTLGIQITILTDATNGIVVYGERHNSTTNNFGLVSLAIGTGTVVVGSFQPIEWGKHLHYIKLDIDPAGGTNYFTLGTSQLVSVPYSLYADKAGNVVDTSATNELQTLSISNDTIYLTNGGFVKLPPNVGVWALDGNNISNNNTGFVGIGTNNPTSALHVNGSVRITDESEGNGKVLTSDPLGNASWQALSSGNVTGTANYVPKFTGTNSIGNSMVYETNNKMGIGTQTPTGRLVVKGDSLANDSLPLFEVQDKNGKTVFVVWPDGAHVYVNDTSTGKANNKGSFAVSGKSTAKGATSEVFVVKPNDIHIYLDEAGAGKANNKGSFAVSGKSTAKGATNDFLSVNSDSIKASKSFYLPRLTTLERDSLGFTPSEALIIFNTTDECMEIFKNGVWSNIWCFNCAPAFMIQPVNDTICSGTNVSFFVSLTGTNLVYQWQESTNGGATWVNISNGGTSPLYSGATSYILTLTNVPVGYHGYKYRCNVSATCPPVVTSGVANLNVGSTPPVIDTHPANQTLSTNCSVTFNINAVGYLSYRWQQSSDGGSTWSNILNGGSSPVFSGASTSSITLSNVPLAYDGYKYRFIVDNSCGNEATSNAATLTVTPISISTHPANVQLSTTCTANFSVSVTGSSLIYQWRQSSDNGTTWTDITNGGTSPVYSGANNSSLSLSNVPLSFDNYKYNCIISHFCRPSVTSNSATLTVTPISISSQPADLQLPNSHTANFSVSASGTTLIYLWQQSNNGGSSWSDISNGGTNPTYSGATTANITITDVPISYNAYKFRCIISHFCRPSINSNSATLTISQPSLTTTSVSNITSTSAKSGGNVISDGGATVTERGICWSTSQNPTTADNFTTNGSGTGSYISNITGLTLGVTYYVRAYATNGIGTSYGTQISFVTALAIGENYQSGIVAYILQSGDPGYIGGETHGLIAAPNDQSTGAEWGCTDWEIIGAYGTAIGTGNQNTINIIADCATAGIAARLCGDLVLGGYSDWYLPSEDELNKLYINKVAIGGFTNFDYWSSSQFDSFLAGYQNFFNGNKSMQQKDFTNNRVRAVRAF